MSEYKVILALYDFASKQEYIYRTSKVKEITGASAMLNGIYNKLIDEVEKTGKSIKCVLPSYICDGGKMIYRDTKPFRWDAFEETSEYIGEVLYNGGGNLMVLYRSENDYIEANKIMSKFLLENVPGLHMICAHVPVQYDDNGNESFHKTVDALYKENARRKNSRPAVDMWEVTPMTQIDPMTFLPVVEKGVENGNEFSLSEDRVAKRKKYEEDKNKNNRIDLSEPDGLAAVVYIDGNSLGKRIRNLTEIDSFEEGVAALRKFSADVNLDFIDSPMKAIKDCLCESDGKHYFRRIVGAGDEITFICDAEDALKLVLKYFESLEASNANKSDEQKNYSCAGIAVIHAKSPFNTAYEIAEAACESAKESSRATNGNYLDFHYCHSGITNDFDTLRKLEQDKKTARPYSIDKMRALIKNLVPKLVVAGRSNVKALGEAAQKSPENYSFEVQRVNAYVADQCDKMLKRRNDEKTKSFFEMIGFDNPDKATREALTGRLLLTDKDAAKEVYDIYEFFDLWFSDASKISGLRFKEA